MINTYFIALNSFDVGLLNLRGSDIEYNPVFFGYALITLDLVYFFVETDQLPENYQEHFAKNDVNVVLHEYYQFHAIFKELIANANGKIWTNPTSSYALSACVPEKQLYQEVIYDTYSNLTKKNLSLISRE